MRGEAVRPALLDRCAHSCQVWAGVVLKEGATLTEAEIRDRVKTKLSKVRVRSAHVHH